MGLHADFIILLTNSSSIGIGAILGLLTRIGVNILFGPIRANITSRDGVLFFDLPANVLGSFVIGVHNSMRSAWYIPETLHLGISTGYAGSLTTFASWHLQVIQMLVGGRVLHGFLALFVGVCLAASTTVAGADFGNLVIYATETVKATLKDKSQARSTSIPESRISEGRDQVVQNRGIMGHSSVSISTACALALFAALLAGMITGTVVDRDDSSSSRLFWTSATFAPVGALLRWRLSFLNRFKPQFPIGTYLANMLATVLDCALLTAGEIDKSLSSEATIFFTALIAGLGGSLSTVSTWISEALKLPPAHRYFYMFCTMISAILLGIAIYGIPIWVNAG